MADYDPTITQNQSEEIWKAIPGYEGFYSVSNLGRVRREPRKSGPHKSGRTLRPIKVPNGYLHVRLCREHKVWQVAVHTVVMLTFLGERKPGEVVNHLDGDKTHNQLTNLEYCSDAANHQHAAIHGLKARGERNNKAQLTSEQVLKMRQDYASGGHTQRSLARDYAVSRGCVVSILSNLTWKHL